MPISQTMSIVTSEERILASTSQECRTVSPIAEYQCQSRWSCWDYCSIHLRENGPDTHSRWEKRSIIKIGAHIGYNSRDLKFRSYSERCASFFGDRDTRDYTFIVALSSKAQCYLSQFAIMRQRTWKSRAHWLRELEGFILRNRKRTRRCNLGQTHQLVWYRCECKLG